MPRQTKQRRLFKAAKSDPAVREKFNINMRAVEKMEGHDMGMVPKSMKRQMKKKRHKMRSEGEYNA